MGVGDASVVQKYLQLKMSLLFQTLFGLFALLSLVHQLDGHNFGPNDQEWSNIIGGEKVHQEHSLPMLVTININLTTKVELLGSGVIINKNWILTVGHLFNEFEKEYVRVYGLTCRLDHVFLLEILQTS